MIAFLSGAVAAVGSGFAVLDVSGVGYRLLMPTRSLASLPAVGDGALVHTYLHVREDELTLYGFADPIERESFEMLLTVSGVGPKVALSVLSVLSPEDLASAVSAEDVTAICDVPGIGRKTAQRMIVDLAGRLSSGPGNAGVKGSRVSTALAEAREALLAMGFTSAEVAVALKGAEAADDVQGVLKRALSRLGSGS